MLAGLLNKIPEGESSQEVTDSLILPVYDTTTDLEDYLYDENNELRNSKIYVVQVNPSIEGFDKEYSGTLKNSISTNETSARSVSDSFTNNEPFPYEVPDFVRNFKKPSLKEDSYFPSLKENKVSFNASVSSLEIGDKRTFMLPENNKGSFVPEECEFVYSSEYADFYYLEDTSDFIYTDEDFEKLGKIFDKIYKAETQLMGSRKIEPDRYEKIYITTPAKVSVVLNDIYKDFSPKKTSGTFGYFSPIDLYSEYAGYEEGNQDQIIYIDSPFYKKYPDTAISTLTHEFNHLLNFVNKEINADTEEEATWYSEMLSLLAEDMLFEAVLKDEGISKNSVLSNRLPWFNGSYNFGTNFKSSNDEVTYAAYGNVFAYGSFLLRNYGGAELLKEIATNPFTDEDSITVALYELGKTSYYDSDIEAAYEDSLIDFACSSLNYKISYGSKANSLNRSVSNKYNGITYKASAINLMDYYQASPDGNKKVNGMKLYQSKDKAAIGPHGFMIQYAGTGEEISEVSVTLPSDKDYNIQMYIYIQYFD